MIRLDRSKLLRATRALILIGMAGAYALAQNLAQAAPEPTLLVVGDSISAEYGLARDTGWVQLLRERLKTEHKDYNVVNASISGDTTSGGLARLPPLLSRYKPAVVVIELGGNDGLRGLPVDVAKDNLAKMIVLSRAAGAKVLIAAIQLPPNYGPQYTAQFAAMFADLAKTQHTALVPFLFAGFAQDTELFQGDRIHPSEQAQAMLLNNVWTPLAPLL